MNASDTPPLGTITETKDEVFFVDGMDCSEEISAIERALKPLPGVLTVRAEVVSSKVTVSHDGRPNRADLSAAIIQAGVTVRTKTGDEGGGRSWLRPALVAASGAATGIGLLLKWVGFVGLWPGGVAFFLAIAAGGALVLPKALRSLRTFTLDINVLMVVAVVGAIAIDETAEGAAVVFLFSLSELLESWSVGRARRAIQALLALTPSTAFVRREDFWAEVAAVEVRPGETILVKPGQKSALDGEVISGQSAMDQSPITGESIPVEKADGDMVFAGAINGEGALEVRVTKAAGDTTVARIIKMVEEAQQQRAPAQRFVDTFAKIYTPAVMALAILLAVVPPLFLGQPWDVWIYRALVMLVIACPCALVISTPVSVVSGLAAMARSGVLIKGGAYLEALAGLRALAVDKTGTITEGKPRVQEVIPWSHFLGVAKLSLIRLTDSRNRSSPAKAHEHKTRGHFPFVGRTLSSRRSRPDSPRKPGSAPSLPGNSLHSRSRPALVNTHFQTWGRVFGISKPTHAGRVYRHFGNPEQPKNDPPAFGPFRAVLSTSAAPHFGQLVPPWRSRSPATCRAWVATGADFASVSRARMSPAS